jgi:uncharacterized protein (TIGR03067 family)
LARNAAKEVPMCQVLFLAAALTVGAPTADKPSDAAKKELDKLQGAWTTTKVIYNGKEYFADGKPGLRFVFKGDAAAVEGNDEVKKEYARLRFKLDPEAKPRRVDLTITEGIQKDAALEGIYELKDDELTICVKVFGNDRPTEFEAPAGSSIALVVLKREKN